MRRPLRAGRLVGVLVTAVLLVGLSGPTPEAAPNPYGARSTATTIVLHADGSYDVTLRQTQELVREYQITFGGGVHDGFRLPDDGALLPPYLRAGYTLTSMTVPEGQPTPSEFTRTNHLSSVRSTGTYPTGTHAAEIRYRVTGAAQPTDRGWAVYVRLLDIDYARGQRVEIDASEVSPTRLVLRCVTFAPDSEPCGTTGGSTLIDLFDAVLDTELPPEYRVEVEADNAAVPEPTIDRR